jgi:hypothetical protein
MGLLDYWHMRRSHFYTILASGLLISAFGVAVARGASFESNAIRPLNSPFIGGGIVANSLTQVANCIVNPNENIQSKINDSSCTVIEIKNGTYQQSIRFETAHAGKQIRGESRDKVIILGNIAASGDTGKAAVNVLADNVTIANLTVDGRRLLSITDPYVNPTTDVIERLIGIGYQTKQNIKPDSPHVKNARIIDVTLRFAGRECIRVMNSAKDTLIQGITIDRCGIQVYESDGDVRPGSIDGPKNGEGIYIGNDLSVQDEKDVPDFTENTTVEASLIQTFGAECIEVKENSSGAVLRGNLCINSGHRYVASDNSIKRGSMINFDGNKNSAINNILCAAINLTPTPYAVKAQSSYAGYALRAGSSESAVIRSTPYGNFGEDNTFRGNRVSYGADYALYLAKANQKANSVCGNSLALFNGVAPAGGTPVANQTSGPFNPCLSNNALSASQLPRRQLLPIVALVGDLISLCTLTNVPDGSLLLTELSKINSGPTPAPVPTQLPPTEQPFTATPTSTPEPNTPTPLPPTPTPAAPTPTPSSGSQIALEAEQFTLTAPMITGNDGAASNSQYIWASGAASAECTAAVTGGWASTTFNVAQAGTHKLWGRTLATDTGRDSMCFQIDNEPIVRWTTSVDPAWKWNVISDTTFALSAGQHTLKFRYREVNTQLDRVIITSDLNLVPTGLGGGASSPTPTPGPTSTPIPAATATPGGTPGNYWFEAEAGAPTSPLVAAADAAASNGQFIWVPSGAAVDCTTTTTGGWATYTVNVATAGTYKIWGRSIAPSTSKDSFCLQVDTGAVTNFTLNVSPTWVWSLAQTPTSSTYTLSAGTHTIKVRYRETGAKLDRLLLTNNLSYTPQ